MGRSTAIDGMRRRLSRGLGRLVGLAGVGAWRRLRAADDPPDPPGWSPDLPPAAGGRFERRDAWPSRHVAPRRVDIWLPPGYDAPGAPPCAVLYMHDGQNLFEPATAMAGQPWAVAWHVAREMREGRMRPTIVVGVWNTARRYEEYVPAAALARLPAHLRAAAVAGGSPPGEAFSPLADAYLRFLVEELKPAIDARYRTRPGPADTAVMGSSMGGLVSLYALASYPQVFGAAGGLSTHWPMTVNRPLLRPPGDPRLAAFAAAYRDWLAQALPPPGRHRLYLDHGDRHLDALYAPFQQAMDTLLATRGYRRGIDLLSLSFPGADHNEPSWRARLGPALAWLLPAA
jgi:enterochelin esterase-like enzyme